MSENAGTDPLAVALARDLIDHCANVNSQLRGLLWTGTCILVCFEFSAEYRETIIRKLIDRLRDSVGRVREYLAEHRSGGPLPVMAILESCEKVAIQFQQLMPFVQMELADVTKLVADLEQAFEAALGASHHIHCVADDRSAELSHHPPSPRDFEIAKNIHVWLLAEWREQHALSPKE